MRCPRLRHGARISLLSCKAAAQAGLQAARPWAGTSPEPCLPCLPCLAGRVLGGAGRKEALLRSCNPPAAPVPLPNLPRQPREKAPLGISDARQLRLFVLSPVQEILRLRCRRKPGETPSSLPRPGRTFLTPDSCKPLISR